ncbi:MAG: LysR family transcriptional regulator substrate-binding protein [Lachnospiraceae bacterium]|nr:LysR family transcriptional regulator substrate-binding protein [Lachnospiraceae bacterium]
MIRKIKDKSYDFIFTTNKINLNNYNCKKMFSEKLYFYLHKNHPLANKKSISFKEMDGESLLMNRKVGFWDKIVRNNMPNSNFILQDNLDNLRILIDNSNISAFASNLTINERIVPNRIAIEIKDKISKVDFYLIYHKNIDKKLLSLFDGNN